MNRCDLSKSDLIAKMNVLKGKMTEDESCVLRINNMIDLLERFPDLGIEMTPSIKYFISICDNPSRLSNLNTTLDSMIEEARSYIKSKQQHIKEAAVIKMRKSRKNWIIAVMVALSFIALGAAVFGVMNAIGKISGAWCDIIGVLDCTGGILFFVYELYDDKIRETKINNGDVEEIEKHTKEIPIKLYEQKNVGAQVNNGTVLGNMNMTSVSDPVQIQDILNKLFEGK